MTSQQQLTKNKTGVFRTFEVKRRLDTTTALYETNWQDLSYTVKRWGNTKWAIDEKKPSFFQQAGLSIVVKNDDGLFDHELNPGSFWYDYLTRYKTLVRVSAGFLDPTDLIEIPPKGGLVDASTSTQMIGLITNTIKLSDSNDATINIKPLSSALEEVPANLLVVASAGGSDSGQLTGSDYIARMRDVTDGSGNFILRKFITNGAWNITSSAFTFTSIDTTTALDSEDCWSLALKVAESSNRLLYISKTGQFNYVEREAPTGLSFVFSGTPFNNPTYGHTIKSIDGVQDDIDLLFNRVIVKYGTNATDIAIKEESWSVGDSTTSWKYGIRTLPVNNEFLNVTTANNVASTLLAEFNSIKDRVDITCKYIPTLNLLDTSEVEYDLTSEGGTRWDRFNWDAGNWDEEDGSTYSLSGKSFKIIGLSHNLDKLDTRVTLRRI